MLRSTVRNAVVAVSSLAAAAPIEVITATFIVITLVYFQLVHAVKGSEFFTTVPSPAPQSRPVHFVRLADGIRDGTPAADAAADAAAAAYAAPHASYAHASAAFTPANDNWLPLSVADFKTALEANALEGGYVLPTDKGGNAKGKKAAIVLVKSLTVTREDGDDAARDAWRQWLLHDVGVNFGEKSYTYGDLCFGSAHCADAPQFDVHPLHDDQATLTLFLRAPSHDTPSLTYLSYLARLPAFTAPGTNTTLHIQSIPPTGSWGLLPSLDSSFFAGLGEAKAAAEDEQNPAVRKVRWFAYAARVLFVRFYTLAKNADSADIFVVLLGYILMHGTFAHLIISMRKLGSSFWLALLTLVSSTFAFLTALLFANLLNVPIDPVVLSEAIPFLVITVGFDKPFRLARAVFEHPDISPVAASPDLPPVKDDDFAGELNPTHLDLGTLHRELAPLERLQKLADGKGIRWVAPVAATQIVVDAVQQGGMTIVRDYALEIAVLSMGAASGIHGVREFCYLSAILLACDCLFLFTFFVAILAVMVEVHRIKIIRGNRRAKAALKRSASSMSLAASTPGDSPPPSKLSFWGGGKEPKAEGQPENPVVRLKLFLIIAFIVLHALNLVTTLTAQTALNRHSRHSVHTEQPLRADVRGTNLSPVLEALFKSLPKGTDMIVEIVTPSHIVMNFDNHSSSGIESFDNFMSEWTTLVGDPVISKWIVVALVVSVLLNGYLLKGIASNSIGGKGPVAAAAQALVGVFEAVDNPGRRMRSPSVLERMRIERSHKNSISKSGHRTNGSISHSILHSHNEGDKTPTHRSNGHSNGNGSAPNGVANGVANGVPNGVVAPVANGVRNGTSNGPINAGLIVPATPAVPIIAQPVLSTEVTPPSEGETNVEFGRRSLEECVEIFAGGVGANNLSDEEVILLVQKGKLAPYALEKQLKNLDRAVRVRRAVVSRVSLTGTLESSVLPMNDFDYKSIIGACCENVVGFMPIPVGIAGPLNIDGQLLHIPMATTEGTLVASTSRGCKALNAGGGVTTVLTQDAMTRGPAIDFPSVKMASDAKHWIDSEDGYHTLRDSFNSTSRFARLQRLECAMAGRTLYVRFATTTGDAMGMNMISKGTEKALETLQRRYPEMDVLALSGNYCTDKKPAAINWIEGRGKSVVAEGIVPGHVVRTVLKTTVKEMVNLNTKKNLIGSAMAGSIGGFNAHAANILTAMFIATGQDPAQNVESSMCMTLMEPVNDGEDLLITCSMPSIEVGTVGGGTILGPQRAMLDMLGIAGAHPTTPGRNSQRLARVICAAVMAGELSLMAALAAGHLIQAHMKHNRSVPVTPGAVTPFGGITPIQEEKLIKGTLLNSGQPAVRLSPPTKLRETWPGQ